MMLPSGEFFKMADTLRELVKAVIDVFEEFAAKVMQPGSEHWTSNEEGRARIHMRVRAVWAVEAKFPEHDCPWTRDAIVSCWRTYRKKTDEEKAAMRAFALGTSLF